MRLRFIYIALDGIFYNIFIDKLDELTYLFK